MTHNHNPESTDSNPDEPVNPRQDGSPDLNGANPKNSSENGIDPEMNSANPHMNHTSNNLPPNQSKPTHEQSDNPHGEMHHHVDHTHAHEQGHQETTGHSMHENQHSMQVGHADQTHDHKMPASHVEHEASHEHTESHADHSGHELMFRHRFWISSLLSIPVLLFSQGFQALLGFTFPMFPGSNWISPVFASIVFVYGGVPFLQMSIPEIRSRKPGMMTLISLAISVAFIYSVASMIIPDAMDFFWELVTLIDIMLLGHWLEMRSIRQASGSLDALAKLMPDTAELIGDDGVPQIVSASGRKLGDQVLVRPGTSIPADGQIIDGNSDVNESMITGESKPVAKHVGDRVIGGSINGDGSLRISISATGDETALAGIMRLVKQAQESKSSTQVLADKAAGWLFYIALGVAAITAIAWIIGTGFNVKVIERVATVLVIACPHALGLAIPLVIAITTEMGARNGILIRDRVQMEKARKIDTVVFDKTGTLTEGRFGVTGIKTNADLEPDQALALAAAIEADSEHTVAQGIRRSASEKSLTVPRAVNFEAIKGRGIRAELDGKDFYVGGPKLLELLDLSLPTGLSVFTQEMSDKGQSVVHLIRDHEVLASLSLADTVRPESHQAVQRLHQMGIKVAMLTGDSEAVAQSVAHDLDIDTYFSEVLPGEKDKKVIELQNQGQVVAMVGDGVNDAPALTRADVGIAIGSGTDVAVESAGIILVKSNPLDVVRILDLSRASYRKMRQNLVWATGYNIIALPLAAGVLYPWGILLSPAAGAVLMSVSTIIVAINAQFLRNQRI